MIAYEGPSLLNGEPIALILTFGSQNRKTGTMIQSWIIPQSDPVSTPDADLSVCGDCPLREAACYVLKFRAPNQIQKTYLRGGYKYLKREKLRNEILRIGSWGDPAAIPFEVWEKLLLLTRNPTKYTGYTHQWRTCDPRFATICMASVETEEAMLEAQALGYKTFRVKDPTELKTPNETLCLNTTAGLTCKNCLLCNGQGTNVVVSAHGARGQVAAYQNFRKSLASL